MLPDLFDATEVAVLAENADAVYALDRKEVGAREGQPGRPARPLPPIFTTTAFDRLAPPAA